MNILLMARIIVVLAFIFVAEHNFGGWSLMRIVVDLDSEILQTAGLLEEVLVGEVRLEVALRLYGRELVSAGKAAELAKISRGEFEVVLTERGLRTAWTDEDLDVDLAWASGRNCEN